MSVKLFSAMAKAFPDIENATKDKVNPAFRSKYADLGAVVEAIKPALVSNDLWFAQVTHEHPGGVCVETIVCHASGEQFSFGKLALPATKQDAQGYGSALTYCRRYSLMAAFGIAAEDDDGNAASKRAPANDPATATGPAISDSQFAQLTTLAEHSGADLRGFCKYFKVDAVKDLPASHFSKAKAMLEKKLADGPTTEKAA